MLFRQKYNKHGADGLYSAIGAGDVRIDQVVNATLAQRDMARKPRKGFLIYRRLKPVAMLNRTYTSMVWVTC